MADREHGREPPPAEARGSELRAILYCIVPRDLATQIHDSLRRHFARDPKVEVVVEQRAIERRQRSERRHRAGEPPQGVERRQIRSLTGRRIADRRATQVEVEGPPLPRRAHRFAERIVFVERLEPSTEEVEDRDTSRLVIRFQSGDRRVFKDLYMRYFDRVYGYMRVALRDTHEAEDQTQQVFAQLLEFLHTYERREQPFRAWLFATARNIAIRHLRKQRRVELVGDEDAIAGDQRTAEDERLTASTLGWISDPDLLLFVERLPVAQRQVLALRFMLGMDSEEIARTLDRSPEAVRQQLSRALRFLEKRLAAVGRAPRRGERHIPARLALRPMRVLRERRFGLISPGPN